MHTKWSLGLDGSVLIANPVPAGFEVPGVEIEKHILEALAAVERKKIKGKEVTAFLLQYIVNHTQGESLETNIALILNNAKVGAGIAVSFYHL